MSFMTSSGNMSSSTVYYSRLVLARALEIGLGQLENAIEAAVGTMSLMLLDLLGSVLRRLHRSSALDDRKFGCSLLGEFW